MYSSAIVAFLAVKFLSLVADHPPDVTSEIREGLALQQQGRFAQAEAQLRIAVRDAGDSADLTPLKISALFHLARVDEDLGKMEEAARLFGKCLSMLDKTVGDTDPKVQTVRMELSALYSAFGQLDTAEKLLNDVITIQSERPDSPQLHQAQALHDLACVKIYRKDYKNAERLARRAISIAESLEETGQSELSGTDLTLSVILDLLRRPFEALEYAERASTALTREVNPNPGTALGVRIELAMLYAKTGRPMEADTFSQSALQMVRGKYGAEHVYTGWIWLARADVLRRLHRKPEAKAAEQRGRSIVAESGQAVRLSSTVPFSALLPVH